MSMRQNITRRKIRVRLKVINRITYFLLGTDIIKAQYEWRATKTLV
jgi:hypothetical protein